MLHETQAGQKLASIIIAASRHPQALLISGSEWSSVSWLDSGGNHCKVLCTSKHSSFESKLRWCHSDQNGHHQKVYISLQIINSGEGVEKKEHSYSLCGDLN